MTSSLWDSIEINFVQGLECTGWECEEHKEAMSVIYEMQARLRRGIMWSVLVKQTDFH